MNLKINFFLPLITSLSLPVFGQTEAIVPPSNRSFASLEKNVLFFADARFKVTQSGSANMNIPTLFDGQFFPSYSSTSIDPQNPYVLLIEDLPTYHAQEGAWIGWTARFYVPTKFKMEVFDTYNGSNQWRTIADVSNNTAGHYVARITPGTVSPSKIRFTIYNTDDTQNRLGISELFYIQPEAMKAYDGLMVQYSRNGNVGIGTWNPMAKLAVEGNILAKEIKVKTDINVPDYVFEPDYALHSLEYIANYVKTHKHLPEIPSANEIKKDGLDLAEMNLLLLKKVEELTLHLIEKDKVLNQVMERLERLESK
ncbi:hypothetical protein K7A41_07675 [Sphingobacterium sp. InxBP1]|uniref:hypothetical protein n=1 Tax=Sphingobacterium sp. InxBP1 TaxID=2870328 RepID=UPI00224451EE|nr:hypothetical protein [Sphingobacterium sp. InxBP1]MCW8311097.1 hypothetical protein [Sphingobacterium sp. InxBP1]